MFAYIAIVLMQNALGGWFSTVIPPERGYSLSAWMMVGNLGGGGSIAIVAVDLTRALSVSVAVVLFGILELVPLAIYPFIPGTAPGRKSKRNNVARLFRETAKLFTRRDVLIALVMFVLPSAAFALTNELGGLGTQFHTTAAMVSLVGGLGIGAAGIIGSLVLPRLARYLPLRPLYLVIGIVGALFTLSLLLLPHTSGTLAVAFVGENLF